MLLTRRSSDSSHKLRSVLVRLVPMHPPTAITPEEPRRVYWTKVSIDDGGVMMAGQVIPSIAHEINQPVARNRELWPPMRRSLFVNAKYLHWRHLPRNGQGLELFNRRKLSPLYNYSDLAPLVSAHAN